MSGAQLLDSYRVNLSGKPDAGKPHVRFDEGDQVTTWFLLYSAEGARNLACVTRGQPRG